MQFTLNRRNPMSKITVENHKPEDIIVLKQPEEEIFYMWHGHKIVINIDPDLTQPYTQEK
jgi:hypothetical protein